jgi:hypothetical protein
MQMYNLIFPLYFELYVKLLYSTFYVSSWKVEISS